MNFSNLMNLMKKLLVDNMLLDGWKISLIPSNKTLVLIDNNNNNNLFSYLYNVHSRKRKRKLTFVNTNGVMACKPVLLRD